MITMRILDKINSSEDIKELDIYSLNVLAGEIREFLIENISNTGGHLSSNLGTVELTLALHKVFDVYNDKIVWDVGHQAYTHKILTGRKDMFPSLRQKNGLSGFPKTEESSADAFNTGHSSTSISAALGFAIANRVKNENNYAVAVIGDGALTGGLAYEAINHAGSQKTPLIVVLNDNGMSISKNVGGLSRHLNKIRNNSSYFTLKDDIKKILDKTPIVGKAVKRGIQSFKRGIKNVVFQNEIFENMGMTYMGPVDGHNIEEMMVVLNQAKKLNEPVIVHILTTKGKGYEFAEKNPDVFHGIQSFDLHTGEVLNAKKKTYSDLFGEVICGLAESNENIVGISAAMPSGTGFINFANKFKDRFFDVGIAEQHAVTFSAALAKDGLTPVFAVYSSFLQRAYDQILHDVALQNLHVVFAIDRAGVVGSDGETHQGVYDLSYLSHIPNIQILAPSCADEMRLMLEYAVNNCDCPVAVRYPRGEAEELELCGNTTDMRIECGKGRLIKSGTDVLIISIGTMLSEALKAAEILEKNGVSAAIFDARFLKPLDEDAIIRLASGCKTVATVEDNTRHGGLFGMVSEILDTAVLGFNFADEPIRHATIKQLRKDYGLDGESIAKKILEDMKN